MCTQRRENQRIYLVYQQGTGNMDITQAKAGETDGWMYRGAAPVGMA